MTNFFCLSSHSKDLVASSVIVSSIAKKLGKDQVLYVRSVPYFEKQYPDVIFDTNLPQCLTAYRRAVHEDVVIDGEDFFINTWVHQLRDFFAGDNYGDSLLQVAKHCMETLGLRKKFMLEDMLSSAVDPEPLNLKTNRPALVCLTRHFCTEVDTTFINQMLSSVSRYDFIACTDKKFMSVNCHSMPSVQLFSRYAKTADAILSTEEHTLFPFFNSIRDKNVFLLSGETCFFDEASYFEKSHESMAKLISSLRMLKP